MDKCIVARPSNLGGFAGTIENPNKVKILVMDGLTGGEEARKFYNYIANLVLELSTGRIRLDFDIESISLTTLQLEQYLRMGIPPWYYTVNWEQIRQMFTSTHTTWQIRQLMYDSTAYEAQGFSPIFHSAVIGIAGENQYSQVHTFEWPAALHELCHNWCYYLGIEDKVHEILKFADGQQWKRLIEYIAEYWPEFEPRIYIPGYVFAPKTNSN